MTTTTDDEGHLLDPRDLDAGQLRAWERLSESAATPNAFLDPAFVVPAVTHLPGGELARLLVAGQMGADGPSWRAMALVLPRRPWRKVPLPALGTWSNDQQALATPLLAADDPDGAARSLVAAVRAAAPRAALLGLDEQEKCGPAAGALNAALTGDGWRLTTWRSTSRAALRRHEADEDTLASVLAEPSRLRSKRRRLEREAGSLRVVDCSAPADAERGARVLLRLEEDGWKGRAGTAMTQRPGEEAMLLDIARAASARGALRLLVLEAGETPVAAQLDLVAGDTWFHFKTAFDETRGATSPGRLLLTEVLRRFDAEDLGVFDACTVPEHPVMDRLLPHRRSIVETAATRGPAATVVARAALAARDLRDARAERAREKEQADQADQAHETGTGS